MLIDLVRLTSNHTFYSGNFKIFKNALGQFIPNCPPKHVITGTNTINTNVINTIAKFLLFWMNYSIDGSCLFDNWYFIIFIFLTDT